MADDSGTPLSSSQDPPRLQNINPMTLWLDLSAILEKYDDLEGVTDISELNRCLDWQGVCTLQDLNNRQRAERHRVRAQVELARKSPDVEADSDIEIIGASLHNAVMHASTNFVIGGITHDIPIIVHTCVEALLRRGIYQNGLFRTLPNKRRLLELVDTFNDGPSYGDGFSLQNETIPDICALLVRFFDSLPHPFVDPVLYDPFWYWCLMPTLRNQNIKRKQQETAETAERGKTIPVIGLVQHGNILRWTKDEEEINLIKEQPQIAAAVTLLKFLPVANLSLLVYVFGFFTQLPLCPDNGIQPDDITRIFGHALIGGESKSDAMQLMLWLLERWPKISVDLFANIPTALEVDLMDPAPPVDDCPSMTSESLFDALDDYSRILESKYTEPARTNEFRKGIYQFAAEGFPASYDLHKLSQVVAGENYLQDVGSQIPHKAAIKSCFPPTVMITNENPYVPSESHQFSEIDNSTIDTDPFASSNSDDEPPSKTLLSLEDILSAEETEKTSTNPMDATDVFAQIQPFQCGILTTISEE